MSFGVTSVDNNGVVKFGFGVGTPKKLSGIQKLIQLVIINLLKTPGRDILAPEKGGGLLGMINGNVDPDDTSIVISQISPAIKKVEKEMLEEQLNKDLPSSERLQRLNLADVSVDSSTMTGYNITIEVLNEDDDIGQASVDTSIFNRR